MKSGNRFIIGLDHGNHLIKTAHHIMQNGVKRLGAKPTFMANTLNYGKTYYKVGEERTSVKDSKMADDDYYILTLAMLAKEAETRDNHACGGDAVKAVLLGEECVHPVS